MVQEDREQKVRHSTPMSFEQLQLAALISDEPPLVTEYVPDVYELEESYLISDLLLGIYKRALEVRMRTYAGTTYITHLIKLSTIVDYFADNAVVVRVTKNDINEQYLMEIYYEHEHTLGGGWVKLQEYASNENNK